MCQDQPEGLDEELYVRIYRKQMAVFRHKIYLALKNSGGMSDMNKDKHREIFMKLAEQKPDFQKKALQLYEVVQKPGDQRPTDLMMREVYLDFFTKSLQETGGPIPYNKRM